MPSPGWQCRCDRSRGNLTGMTDAARFVSDGSSESTAFNAFLHIGEEDVTLLSRYRTMLLVGADAFVASFYAFLREFPATSKTISRYQADGGDISHLVAKQTTHLRNLLNGDVGPESARHLKMIGDIHYQRGIEPVWVIGAYHLYSDHLRSAIDSSAKIPKRDRVALETAVIKLLFRDMGLLLDGYWSAAMAAQQVLAVTDDLTRLPNRTVLRDRLNRAIAAAGRNPGQEVALLLLGLNRFQEINDTLGHSAGDDVLRQVAARLSTLLGGAEALARFGGDEFAIVLPKVSDGYDAAKKVAGKVLESLIQSFRTGSIELFASAAMGIACYPQHGDDVESVMRRADTAMYRAKKEGVDYLLYDLTWEEYTEERLQFLMDLRYARERNEFTLHYQPQIDVRSGTVVAVEALLRWRHPERGLVMPGEFIPYAEATGLIGGITNWVLDTASTQCREWKTVGANLRIAVNLTARSLRDPELMEKIMGLVRGHGPCKPSDLEIEITESVLMEDTVHGARVLQELDDLGISIAIDDFGTGYSSLAYLKKLPISSIKVDKSFIINMASSDEDAIIVRSIIALAHNLGCTVVAEGVESEEVLQLIEMLGCDYAQGYHIARPMPPAEFVKWRDGFAFSSRETRSDMR